VRGCEGGGEGRGIARAPPAVTGADSSAGSINDLGKQRFNQMITHRVLGTVLLGVNEQINCSDCVSAFGSAGSFSQPASTAARNSHPICRCWPASPTPNSARADTGVTSAPIGAFAPSLRFHRLGVVTGRSSISALSCSPSEKVALSAAAT